MEQNDFDRSVETHRVAKRIMEVASADGLDSEVIGRAMLLAAATLAKASGARHKTFRIAADQAWERVSAFSAWLEKSAGRVGWLLNLLRMLGFPVAGSGSSTDH